MDGEPGLRATYMATESSSLVEQAQTIRQFFRLRFSKQGDVRFASHHDMMRVFERVLRRAALPLAMSRGFNPRPQISLPAPLSVGIAGQSEVVDFELAEWIRPDEVAARLERQMPKGIRLESLCNLPSRGDRRPRQFSYLVPLLVGHGLSPEDLEALLQQDEVPVERSRRGEARRVDIRPFIGRLRLGKDELHLLLHVTDAGTARPEEVLAALGCRPGMHYLRGAIERTRVNLSSSL